MKRRLLIIAVFLLAGLIVAGGCESPERYRLKRNFRPQGAEAILAWDEDFVIEQITTSDDYQVLRRIRFWCAYNGRTIIPRLIELLTDPTVVGLRNSADLIIWERIERGDLKFYGHGGIVEDDIFSIAGRASWYLNSITGKKFGHVGVDPQAEDLIAVQSKWETWWRSYRLWWWD